MQNVGQEALSALEFGFVRLIDDYREHVRSYQSKLNEEGIWLLLATLGCWGVTDPKMCVVAYLLVLAVFANSMNGHSGRKGSFTKQSAELRQCIEQDLPYGDTQQRLINELAEVNRVELGPAASFGKNILFFLCWTFWGFSFVFYGLMNILPHK